MSVPISERLHLNHPETPRRERSLQEEINYLRFNYFNEGLPRDWYILPATGFQVDKQTNLLYSQLKTEDTPVEKFSQKQKWLEQTDRDIKGFIIEYLTEKLVFPIHYTILPEEGRVVDRFYGNKNIEDIVTSEERKGSVKRSMKAVKDFFLSASSGAIVVMTSPSGWSGMKLKNGDPITYPDSQTYIWKKQGNDIWGFTIKTDFYYKEHRELLKRLAYVTIPEEAPVEQYVEATVGIIPGENPEINEIQDVVNIMRDIRFKERKGSLYAFKDRMWAEVYKDLERREELWKYDEKTAEIVQEFKDYFMAHNLTEHEIQEALSVTILRIAKFLRGDSVNKPRIVSRFDNPVRLLPGFQTYGDVLNDVQKIPGCAGGGNSGNNLVKSITWRSGVSMSAEEAKRDPNLCKCNNQEPHFHCEAKKKDSGVKCNQVIIVGEGIESCPGCGTEKVC